MFNRINNIYGNITIVAFALIPLLLSTNNLQAQQSLQSAYTIPAEFKIEPTAPADVLPLIGGSHLECVSGFSSYRSPGWLGEMSSFVKFDNNIIKIPSLRGGTAAGQYDSRAKAINKNCVVAGTETDLSGEFGVRSYLFDPLVGELQDISLSIPGVDRTQVMGLNSSGHSVGMAGLDGVGSVPYALIDGSATILSAGVFNSGWARDIDDKAKIIVGAVNAECPGTPWAPGFPAIWEDDSEGFFELSILPVGSADLCGGQVFSISDDGRFLVGKTGSSILMGETATEWRRRSDGTWNVRHLKNLPGVEGNTYNFAYDVNKWGHIVGTHNNQGVRRAVLWVGNQVYDLNDHLPSTSSGIHLTSARAINDDGIISVQGHYKSQPGTAKGFLLKP